MDLLYSILVLFSLALIWTGAIFLLFRKMIGRQIKRDIRMLLGGFFLFIALMAIVLLEPQHLNILKVQNSVVLSVILWNHIINPILTLRLTQL